MRLKLTFALVIAMVPACVLAQPRTVSTHTRPQLSHDRAPRLHDRAPRPHVTTATIRS